MEINNANHVLSRIKEPLLPHLQMYANAWMDSMMMDQILYAKVNYFLMTSLFLYLLDMLKLWILIMHIMCCVE